MTEQNDDTDEIDPGIAKTVDWLRCCQFDVFDSSDGHGECEECGAEHEEGVPFIVIFVEPTQIAFEANRLLALLRSKVVVPEYNKDRPVRSIDIEAKYEPIMNFATLEITYITDAKVFGEDPAKLLPAKQAN